MRIPEDMEALPQKMVESSINVKMSPDLQVKE